MSHKAKQFLRSVVYKPAECELGMVGESFSAHFSIDLSVAQLHSSVTSVHCLNARKISTFLPLFQHAAAFSHFRLHDVCTRYKQDTGSVQSLHFSSLLDILHTASQNHGATLRMLSSQMELLLLKFM